MTEPALANGGGHGAERPAVEDRGTLRVHPAVVARIAERAADATAGTVAVSHRFATAGTGRRGCGARVSDRGDALDIALNVAVRYPASVSGLSERLRGRVSEQVQRLTGRRVRRVAVTVSALLPESRRLVK